MFPLPPEKEMKIIVQKVDASFKIYEQLESQITKSRQNSEMVMQAVLKEAFEG